MAGDLATASANSGSNGFFSKVTDAFGEGVAKIGKDLLPVWAGHQIEKEMDDGLKNDTFDPNAAPPRLNADGQTVTNASTQQSALSVGGNTIRLSTGVITLGAVALVAVALLLTKD